MGSSKTHQYCPKQLSFAQTAKAIGHPARVMIVQELSKSGLLTNYEMMRFTTLSEGTVHQHLRELVRAGLISELYIQDKHYYKLTNRAKRAVMELQFVFDDQNKT